MPSPGATAIAHSIGGKNYVVEGNFATGFTTGSPFVSKLATAMDTGWTSSSPSTSTSMDNAFASELGSFLQGAGLAFLNCVAQSIDAETTAWVNSWNGAVHTFVVSAPSIVDRIMACAPVASHGVQALAEAVADAFMSGFGQETG